MIKIEYDCVGCGLPCLGSACPYREVPYFYCDDCEYEYEELFHYEGKQLCIDCVAKRLRKVTIDDYE